MKDQTKKIFESYIGCIGEETISDKDRLAAQKLFSQVKYIGEHLDDLFNQIDKNISR